MISWLDCLVMAEDLLESEYIYLHIYLQIACFSNSAAICYSRFGIVLVICYFNMFIFSNIKQLQLWGHILHKLQRGSLPTLSNSINRSNIIQADLYHKIARYQMIGSFNCLVVAGDLWEADYICPYTSLQVTCCSNSAVIGYSKLENVSVISNINMFILPYIRQLQLWNFLRTYIG
jgi:hypothetical protein